MITFNILRTEENASLSILHFVSQLSTWNNEINIDYFEHRKKMRGWELSILYFNLAWPNKNNIGSFKRIQLNYLFLETFLIRHYYLGWSINNCKQSHSKMKLFDYFNTLIQTKHIGFIVYLNSFIFTASIIVVYYEDY